MDDDVVVIDDPAVALTSASERAPATQPTVEKLASTAWPRGHVDVIQDRLLAWYDQNRRRLPWRGDDPPYGGATAGQAGAVAHGSSAAPRGEGEGEEGAGAGAGAVAHGSSAAPRGEGEGEEGAGAGAGASAPVAAVAHVDGKYHNAYGTWVSEIMLQQTRVETVIPYWLAWMARWPTVAHLAGASEDEVNAAWAGLGFYRRARNLHKGAKTVLSTHGGSMPSDLPGLKSLPGIGDYTAGAIGSIAYGLRVPLVDGNVIRVFSRLRGLNQDAKDPKLAKLCWSLAAAAVPSSRPGSFNQALMELGATHCAPKGPDCKACPLREAGVCEAYKQAEAAVLSGRAVKDVEDLGSAASAGAGAGEGSASTNTKPKMKQTTLSWAATVKKPVPADPVAQPSAARSPSSSSSSPHPLSPDQWKVLSTWIAERYPLKTVKKVSPVDKVLAVFVMKEGSPIEKQELLFVRRPVTSGPQPGMNASGQPSTGKGGEGEGEPSTPSTPSSSSSVAATSALLAGQWAPCTYSMGRVAPQQDEEEEEEGEGEGADGQDGEEGEGARAGTSSAGKRKRQDKGMPTAAKGSKKAKLANGSSTPTLDLDTAAAALASSLGLRLQGSEEGAGAAGTTSDAYVTRMPFGTFTHVFSHVTHIVTVEKWILRSSVPSSSSSATCAVELLDRCTRQYGSGCWAGVVGMEALGLTTWTAKALYAVLGSVYLARVATSMMRGGKPASDAEGMAEDAAWQGLAARWKKAGCAGV